MEKQIAKKFDIVTLKKIGKGALIAFTGGGVLALLGYMGQLQVGNPLLAGFIAWIVPTLTNLVKEWLRGEGISR